MKLKSPIKDCVVYLFTKISLIVFASFLSYFFISNRLGITFPTLFFNHFIILLVFVITTGQDFTEQLCKNFHSLQLIYI